VLKGLRVKRLYLLPVVLAAFVFAVPSRAQTSDAVDLAGPWKFMKGDNTAWAKLDFVDTLWKEINVPGSWQDQGNETYQGFAWYRKHIALPEAWKTDTVVKKAGVLGLDLGEISDSYEVYFNGVLVKQSGKFPPLFEPSGQKAMTGVPVEHLNWGGDNVIAVRVYDQSAPGGIVSGNPVLRKPTYAEFMRVDVVGKGNALEFKGEDGLQFDVIVSNNGPADWQAGTVLLSVYDSAGAQMLAAPQNVDVSAGKQRRISQGLKDLEPGLYTIRAAIQMDGKKMDEAQRTFAYNPGGIRGESIKSEAEYKEVMTQLDGFWKTTLAELQGLPLNATVTPAPEKSSDKVKVSKVAFKSVGGQTIHGWLALPATATASAKVPGIVVLPGFGTFALDPPTYLAEQGYAALYINVHGQQVDAPSYPPAADVYMKGSLTDPAGSVPKAMVAAGLRAVEFLAQQPEVNADRLGVTGVSQGGWLALDVAALDPRIKAVAANSPAADFPRMVASGKENPLRPLIQAMPAGDQQGVMRMLRYFEPTLLAERIKVPALLTVGLRDNVTPPMTAYALKNAFPRGVAVMMNISETGGHTVTAEQGAATLAFLKKFLIG
jgi:cephalosporin-C deacetylase-like acetyl esterase